MRVCTLTRRVAVPLAVWTLLMSGAHVSAQEETPSGVIGEAVSAQRTREDTLETARGVAMGLGSRANVSGGSALAYNPANLPLGDLYEISTLLSYIPNDRTFGTAGTIVDSSTNKLAAGFSFRGVFGNRGRNYSGWDLRAGFGLPITEKIFLGASARYMRLNADQHDANGEPVGDEARGFTLDGALTLKFAEWLSISGMAYNLIALDSALAPLQFGASVGFAAKEVFHAGIDVLVDISSFQQTKVLIGLGAEVVLGEKVPLRLGYRRDQGRDRNTITFGVGYLEKKVGLDFGLRQDVGGNAETRDTHMVIGLRYLVR